MDRLETSTEAYIEHEGVVVDKGEFSHVMALALNPLDQEEGVIRCIVNRSGKVDEKGYVDRSVLYKVASKSGFEQFEIKQPLEIKGKEEIINELKSASEDFIGLEDPDIVVDPHDNLLHLYFTIPLLNKSGKGHKIHLGHAQGKNLDSLEMTTPVLSPTSTVPVGAKELSLAPVNKSGVRLNLVESSDEIDDSVYSTVRIGVCESLGEPWQFGDVVIHPKFDGHPWCAEHASPGPLLPQEFIDLGEGKRLGILNGREASIKVDGKTKYGMFSAGLFIYDYEQGRVDWISEKPLITDSMASTITFASEFVQIDDHQGVLYAHVDDSFVRAYTLDSIALKKIIPHISLKG